MTRILTFLLLLTGLGATAQGYKIEIQLNKAADSDVKLTYYYLGNIYSADETKLDSTGYGIFEGDSLLHQGLYKIVLDQNTHFDFLLGADQQFKITNTDFNSVNMQIEGAPETEGFVDYLKFFDDLIKQKKQLEKELSDTTISENKTEKIKKKMEGLNDEMLAYRKKISKKFPDSFLPCFIAVDYVPKFDSSTLPKNVQENDSLLFDALYRFNVDHYWDYFDYTDERYLYSPFYKPKLEKWFSDILYPSYDSVKPYVYKYIDDIKPSKRIFQFAVSFFLNAGINSKIMGMDALFVDLARDYYLSGKAFWASKKTIKKVRENYIFLKDNLIGGQAYDLNLENIDGEHVDLYQIVAKRTILVTYEPDCSHCKEFIPKLYDEVYIPFRDKGLEVYAIYSMDKKEEWKEFVEKERLYDWVNVWDKDDVSKFKIKYDARANPSVYLLDEDKKIIAKKLSVDQLKKIISADLK